MNEDFFSRLVAQAFVADDGEDPPVLVSSSGLVATLSSPGVGQYRVTLRRPGAQTALDGRGLVHVTPISLTFLAATATLGTGGPGITNIDVFLWDAAGGPATGDFCVSLWLLERFGGKTLPVTSPPGT